MIPRRILLLIPTLLSLVLVVTLFACVQPAPRRVSSDLVKARTEALNPTGPAAGQEELPFLPPSRDPNVPILTPTPDPPHPLPTMRVDEEIYVVQPGDTVGIIAERYSVRWEDIVTENELYNPDLLEVGQTLVIPVPPPSAAGPDFKIIPDSELVYGPASAGFNVETFIQQKGGYLSQYFEEVEGVTLTGAQIVNRVSQDYSVNPRLLLAALEYQSNWLTASNPDETSRIYPMGYYDSYRSGLYAQLAWAANSLNRGFYVWRVGGVANWVLPDGTGIPVSPTLNAGTAGVQYFFSLLYNRDGWWKAVSPEGFFALYQGWFGYPFDLAIEPLVPADLVQPPFILPIEPGQPWSFTGGPHGGWADGSAWAALDFAPPGDALGCVQSDAWVTAMADGVIVRTGNGAVIQDLDGDGYEQTGWTIFYMHIETRDRIQPGTVVKAGDRIGHPSCEGGFSSGTHTHIARRYNGEWISADGQLPFNMDGWISSGNGIEYDGFLTRNEQILEAYSGRSPQNQVIR